MSPERQRRRVVVVGGGSAGCVVAARLAQAGVPTTLFEAGPAGGAERPPGEPGLIDPEHHPNHYWPPLTVTGESNDGAAASYRYWMGRGLGGGSAVNGMLIMPGDEADYDRWAAIDGCSDWSAEAMAPWLAKAAAVLEPEPPAADADVSDLVGAFDDGFGEIGLRQVGTTLDRDRCGLLTPMLATRSGLRRSVADAYLSAAEPNLTVRTARTVTDLVVDNGTVGGVALADGEVVAASTVVLAAGTVGTAKLLHDTGAVPNAGRWIRNHLAAAVAFPWPADAGPDRPPRVHRVARWWSGTDGPDRSVDRGPDLTATLMGPFAAATEATGAVIVMASTVRSSGRLEFGYEPLRLLSGQLTAPEDRAVLRSGTRQALVACGRLAGLAGGDRSDAARRSVHDLHRATDQELDDWLVGHPGPVYHAVGSCRMGQVTTSDAVTAAEHGRAGTLPGLDGIVVADASLFPDLVAGGLQLPVMAVAERITAETLLG